MLDDIVAGRKNKLEALRREGVNAYPSSVKRMFFAGDVLASFSALVRKRTKVSIAGRVMGLRDQGNLLFVDVQDATGKIQAVLKKDFLDNFKLLKLALDIGDFIEVAGPVFKTKKGEKSIEVRAARIIVKAFRPLPSEWYGLQDTEERFRKRYLDFLINPESKKKIEMRSAIVLRLREDLHKEGFLEVETPMLQPIPGGALAKPFATHHNALDQDFYLRIAPELYLKRLLTGGFEKIFELGRVFRNEGIDHDHNPEFTMLELYWAYQDWEGLMKFTTKLLKPFLKKTPVRITYAEGLKKYAGKDVAKLRHEEIDEVFKREVRPKIVAPTFVTHYPTSISPLAKSVPGEPDLAQRFQLVVAGTELVNGFSELNDPGEQRLRMEEQEKRHRGGDEEASRFDEDFLHALEYGMPPAAGLGIGIDRLVMFVTKTENIKEVIAFPTLRSKE